MTAPSAPPPARLLLLGTGHIANRHAQEFASLRNCTLVAAVDTNAERVLRFAEQHGIGRTFTDLRAALDWGAFDAAVNATPDAVHLPTTLDLVAARKAVFCEKPLAIDHPGAMIMTEAAEAAGLINMVNLTYRNAVALQKARQMIDAGVIGTIRHIEASYLQSWLTAKHWGDWRSDERWLWRLSSAHGSQGVLGDIGIHILDFVTFGTGLSVDRLQARVKTFDKVEGGRIGAYRLDANDSVAMTIEMDNGAIGVVHMTRFATGNLNDLNLALYGESGALKIWANHEASWLDACLGVDAETQTWRRIVCPMTPRNEQRFAEALRTGINGQPDFRHAAAIQHLLDLSFVSNASGSVVACRQDGG